MAEYKVMTIQEIEYTITSLYFLIKCKHFFFILRQDRIYSSYRDQSNSPNADYNDAMFHHVATDQVVSIQPFQSRHERFLYETGKK